MQVGIRRRLKGSNTWSRSKAPALPSVPEVGPLQKRIRTMVAKNKGLLVPFIKELDALNNIKFNHHVFGDLEPCPVVLMVLEIELSSKVRGLNHSRKLIVSRDGDSDDLVPWLHCPSYKTQEVTTLLNTIARQTEGDDKFYRLLCF